MNFCRRNAGVVAHDGVLYIIGGDDGTTNLSSVEVYTPETDTWRILGASMTIGRSYAGVAIIDKPLWIEGSGVAVKQTPQNNNQLQNDEDSQAEDARGNNSNNNNSYNNNNNNNSINNNNYGSQVNNNPVYENVSVAQIVNLQHANPPFRANQNPGQMREIQPNYNYQPHYMNRNEVYDRTGGYDVPRSLGNNYYVNVPPTNMRPSYMDLSRARCPSLSNSSRKQRSFDDTESCYYSHYVKYENMYEKVKDEPFYQNGTAGGHYGRLDVIGHGIGRIERHLSSSCNNIDHYNTGRPHLGTAGQVQPNIPAGSQSQNQKDLKDTLSKSRIFGCLGGESQSMNNINGEEQGAGTRGNFMQPSTSQQGQASARNTGAIPKSRNKVAPKPTPLPQPQQQQQQQQNSLNRISKSSLQYLLINKWIPLFIGGSGPDYKIIDFNFMFNRNERNQGLVRFNGEAEYSSFMPSTSREYPTLGNYPRVIRNQERMSHLKECDAEMNMENPEYRAGPSRARSESPLQMQNCGENDDPFRNWSFNFENNSFRPARRMRPDGSYSAKDYQEQNPQKEQDMEFEPQIHVFGPPASSSKSSSPTDSDNSAYSIASIRSGATEMKKSENYDNLASLQEALPTENISNDSLTLDENDGDEDSDSNEFQLEID